MNVLTTFCFVCFSEPNFTVITLNWGVQTMIVSVISFNLTLFSEFVSTVVTFNWDVPTMLVLLMAVYLIFFVNLGTIGITRHFSGVF